MNKWTNSLELEKKYWMSDEFKAKLSARSIKRKKEADQFWGELCEIMNIDKDLCILQVGSAAMGIINDFQGRELFAIDPLADFFKTEFPNLLNNDVRFIAGVGENMPYQDCMFDIIICTKTLAHVNEPIDVLKEVFRTLKDGGVFYCTIDIYPFLLAPIAKLVNKKDFNVYTISGFTKLLHLCGFNVVHMKKPSIRSVLAKSVRMLFSNPQKMGKTFYLYTKKAS